MAEQNEEKTKRDMEDKRIQDMSPDEINAEMLGMLEDTAKRALQGVRSTPLFNQRDDLSLPIIAAYVMARAAEKQNNASKKFANWSIGLIVASIIISIVTSTVVICSSNSWQAEQTPLLQRIVENTKPADK